MIVEMADDAGDRIFFVGENRTAVQTGRIGTVVAGGSDRLSKRVRAARTDQQTYIAPGFIIIQSVQRVTGGDARLAPRAGVEFDRTVQYQSKTD